MNGLRLLVLIFLLVACSQSPSKPGSTSGASLEVQISGLPTGLTASVKVKGSGVDETLSASKTFADLAAGTYTFTSSPIQNSLATFVYNASSLSSITLKAGDKKTVFVTYTPAALRATADRPDDLNDYQIHVIYAVPSDGADRKLDTNGQIANSVSAFQTWLKAQTGGKALRLDTAGGNLDITFVRLTQTDAQLQATNAFVRDYIENELMGRGFTDQKKIYAVYYDGGSNYSCGGGALPPVLFGTAGVMYLNGNPPGAPACNTNVLGASPTTPGYLDFGMLHETVHTLGGSPACASSQSTPGHVADSPTDLMYAGSAPWQPSVLDFGSKDYYGTGRTDCVDIAKSAFLEPAPTGAVPPPGWPWATIPDLGCEKLGQVQSGMGNQTKLRIVNARNEELDLSWIDGAGQAQFVGILKPFSRLDFNTLAAHPWMVKSKTGQCLGIYRTGEILGSQGVAVVR